MKTKTAWQFVRTRDGKNYLTPFLLITTLFFLWGFAHSMLDVLNKHFQQSLQISMIQAAFVQNAVYGGYFLMAIPAGKLISRFGYRAGVLTGLLLFGLGALSFIPGSLLSGSPLAAFYSFVLSLFVIGCGLTCLETSANPYVTVLGEREAAERRINFSQSFNGLGWILGPLVGLFLFREGAENDDVVLPYAIIGVVVLAVAAVFSRVKLPEVEEEAGKGMAEAATATSSVWSHPRFVFGLLALFLYVAAQTGLNSFFINYATDEAVGISNSTATLLLSFVCMGLFMLGRLGGSWFMGRFRAERLLALCALGATAATTVIALFGGRIGMVALFVCYFCESIMFPTIFALTIRGLGEKTKQASSYLIMSIVGGAIAPTLMAKAAEAASMQSAFIIPLVCFAVIAIFALRYKKLA